MFDWCYFLWRNQDLLSKIFSCAILRKQKDHIPASLPSFPSSLFSLFPSLPLNLLSFSHPVSPFFSFCFSTSQNAHVHKHDGCLILWINWQCWSTAVCRPHLSPQAARHTFKLTSQRLRHLDCSTNWYDQPDPATIDLHSSCHPVNWNPL